MDVSIEDIIQITIDKMMENKPGRNREKIEEIVRNYFELGIPFYKSMGITEDFMTFLYANGYQSFQAGKYEEARAAFDMLHTYDPDEPKYILAKALCFKEMKKYANAINEFMNCAAKSIDDPIPYWYMYECFDKMDDEPGKTSSLGAVIYLCNKTKENEDLKLRAEMALVNILKNQLEEPQDNKKPSNKKVKNKI